MSFRVAVDIGGTFTDCVVIDADGQCSVSKCLTTHEDPIEGVLAALAINASQREVTLRALLENATEFVHGTTVATNAVLTRTGARTALIITRGHEGTLPIGKVQSHIAGLAERDIVHLSRLEKPVPLVPRELIRGVTERIDREGEVVVPLDLSEARAAIDDLLEQGVEAIAVCFLWSFVNPRHEWAVRGLIAEAAPGLVVGCSHELAPVLGEYERAVATVLNVYLGPQVTRYLEQLERRLRHEGLRVPLFVMQANGGLSSAPEASRAPLVTLDSGPTGGILGCRYLASRYGERDVICTDVGGTSFDVGLILGGAAQLESEPVVSQHRFRLSKVSVHSIGAGGGSIAWIDEGGLLRVGPHSAGSRPGPACYRLGGEEATVTDADLALGYLDPDFFLGGRMRLERERSMTVLSRLGAQLDMEPEEVALGIFRITNAQMADLIRRATIERGYDPRQCVLAAYGGAAATHAAFYGTDIGARTILIPPGSTAFSAMGMLTCDIVHVAEASKVVSSPFDGAAVAAAESEWRRLEAAVLAQFERESIGADAVDTEWVARARYRRQVHTIDVRAQRGGASSLADLQPAFERRYAEVYGERAVVPDGRIELVMLRVVGSHRMGAGLFSALSASEHDAGRAHKGTRRGYFDEGGFLEVDVFDGDALEAGATVTGPAIIERVGDTVVIPPGLRAEFDRFTALSLKASSPVGADAAPSV